MRLILTFLATLAFVAVGAQTASPSLGCLPLEVDFSPPDGGAAFWDFGDGVTSNLSSPSHVYNTTGTFTVTFRRADGGPIVGSTTVSVYPTPTISLTQDTTGGCAPITVGFEAVTTINSNITVSDINWAFGDGGSGSGQIESNTYTRAGIYDVTVEVVTDINTCNVTEIFEDVVEVFAQPAVRFTTDPSPAQQCDLPLILTVDNRTTGVDPITYNWDFGNGETSDDEEPGATTYDIAGAFTISLTGTDANGCEATFTAPVSAGPPNPNFDLPDTVCFNEVYRTTALGAADIYTWSFGNGVVLISDENETQAIQFTESGLTTVTLAVENTTDGCQSDTIREIFVQRLFVDAESDPSYFCERNYSIDYQLNNTGVDVSWTFPQNQGSSTDPSTSASYTYDEGGEYGQNWWERVRTFVTITSPQGCTADTILVDTIDVPNALFFPNQHQGCAPLQVIFADSVRSNRPVLEYVIDWGDGQVETFTNGGPWVHTYTSAGEYQPFIRITNSLGCVDTSYSQLIEVGEPITNLTYTSDASPACPGDTITFTSTTTDPRIDAIHFEVEGGNTHHCLDEETLRFGITNPIEGNTLDLTFSVEYNGCISEASESFPYAGSAIADLDYEIFCSTPDEVHLYGNSSDSNLDSLYVIGITDTMYSQAIRLVDSITYNSLDSGAYQAVLVSTDGGVCGPNRDTIDFYITNLEAKFELDSIICQGFPLPLDASMSTDVNAACSKGYQWDFSFRRPYTTEGAIVPPDDITADARGLQTVSLIVDDINGCRDTLDRTINIFGTQLDVSASDRRICLPASIDFTVNVDSDTTIVDYMWDFGGYGTSTAMNPSFTFPDDPDAPDEIIVTLMTTDELSCPGMAEIVIEVYRPESNVLVSRNPICSGESIEFTATDFTQEGNNLTFDWNFGNGITSSNQSEIVTYNTAGTFNATLNFTETNTGCMGDTTVAIEVQQTPVLSFTTNLGADSVSCFPDIITFTNNSPGAGSFTPIWVTTGGVAVGNQADFGLPRGTSDVSLIGITTAGCSDTLTRSFTLVGPEANFVLSDDLICQNEEITVSLRDTMDLDTWTFDFGNGVVVDNTDPASITYTTIPATGFRVIALNGFGAGCPLEPVLDTVFFETVIADFITDDGDSIACDPDVMFIDQSTGAELYSYSFGNGDMADIPSPTYTFPEPGDYRVLLEVSKLDGGCPDSISKVITVLPDLDLTVDFEDVCENEQAEITVNTSRGLVSVNFAPDVIERQDSNIYTTIPLTETTPFQVSVIDSFGCEDEIVDLQINVGAIFNQPNDTFVILAGNSQVLPVENPGGFTFNWLSPGDPGCEECVEVGCDDCDNPEVTPEVTSEYRLRVTDDQGCTEVVIVFLVEVAPPPIVPNLFSPNGDGVNDVWGPLLAEGVEPMAEVYQVYSRWGNLVFESDNVLTRWDGTNKDTGNEVPSDVYAYVIKLIYPDQSEFNAAGELTLVR